MKKTGFVFAVLIVVMAMALPAMAAGSAQGVTPTATVTTTVTTVVTATATVSATATTLPTATPQATYTPLPPQPTYTLQPTYTPLPTQTPLAQPTAAPTVAPTAVPTVEIQPGLEAGDGNGKFVFGGSFTLHSGDQLNGDLVVFGGSATVQSDARVNGNVVIIGGGADIAGQVHGDLVLIGGESRLRSTAVVNGQLVRVGGGLQKDEGAQILGGESGGIEVPPVQPPLPPTPRPFENLPQRGVNSFLDFVRNVWFAIGATVMLAALALFAVALWRDPIERVERVIVNSAGVSWVVGFLTPVAFAVIVPALAILSAILVFVCVGFLGFGAIVIVSLALGVAWMMGWIALGKLVGERVLVGLNVHGATPAVTALVGTALITLLWQGLNAVGSLPCLTCLGVFGWLFFIIAAPVGLGAVVLTRFGTQDYLTNHVSLAPIAPIAPAAPSAPSAPEAPEPPAEPVSSSNDKPAGEL